MHDLLYLDSCRRNSPSPFSCNRAPSSINLSRLDIYFRNHPDPRFSSYIYNGLRHGFRIGFDYSSPLRSTLRNHPSSGENPAIAASHIREEMRLGRVVGPVPQLSQQHIHTSPIGLVPKHHSDKWRLIIDLSFPASFSVNDGITSTCCSLQYSSVENAVDIINHLGRGTELVKIDLSNAYRIVPVHPDDQPLLGICWQGNTYVDRALPFGLRSAPKIFSAVADFLTWILHCEGVLFVIHYLDDFLIFGPPGTNIAATARSVVEGLFDYVNVPIAHHKTEGPATSLTFLGIMIDTARLQLSLPLDKVTRLQSLLRQWRGKKCCTRKELESLAGHLSHAATVVRPGRIFLRNLFSLLSKVSKPTHFTRLNLETRADLAWWQCLLQHWNGISFFPPAIPTTHIYSDASGSFGCGAFYPEHCSWFQLAWPSAWDTTGITAKELLPIIVASLLFGRHWAGMHVCFHSDNEAVVSIIQKRNAKHPLLTHLLRCLFFYASIFCFEFSSVHIPGTNNVVADAISRNNMSLLYSLFPQAIRVIIHQPVSEFLLFLPDWGSLTWTERFSHSLSLVSPHPHPGATVPVSVVI